MNELQRAKLIQEQSDAELKSVQRNAAGRFAPSDESHRTGKNPHRKKIAEEHGITEWEVQKAKLMHEEYEATQKSSGGQIGNKNAEKRGDEIRHFVSGGSFRGNQYAAVSDESRHLPKETSGKNKTRKLMHEEYEARQRSSGEPKCGEKRCGGILQFVFKERNQKRNDPLNYCERTQSNPRRCQNRR